MENSLLQSKCVYVFFKVCHGLLRLSKAGLSLNLVLNIQIMQLTNSADKWNSECSEQIVVKLPFFRTFSRYLSTLKFRDFPRFFQNEIAYFLPNEMKRKEKKDTNWAMFGFITESNVNLSRDWLTWKPVAEQFDDHNKDLIVELDADRKGNERVWTFCLILFDI